MFSIFKEWIEKYAKKHPREVLKYVLEHPQKVKKWIEENPQQVQAYLTRGAQWIKEHPQEVERYTSQIDEFFSEGHSGEILKIFKFLAEPEIVDMVGASFGREIKEYIKSHPQAAGKLLRILLEKGGEMLEDVSWFLTILSKLTEIESYQRGFQRMIQLIREGHPLGELWKRAIRQTNPTYRSRILYDFFVNSLGVGGNRRRKFYEENNIWPPYTLVLNPTERCNIYPPCKGCYAAQYRESSDLPLEFIDKVLEQAKNMGIYFVVLSGGEPTLRFEEMSGLLQKHQDMVFHMYTNGLRFADEKFVEKVLPLGNVIPLISIEGSKQDTDARRGEGVYDKVMRAMDNLRETGIPFGISVTHTSRNGRTILSDKFRDMMIEKGAIVAWYFQYIPIGDEPDMSLMVSASDRLERWRTLLRWWNEAPIFVADFWNNGPWVGGCIAARKYMDIIPIPFPMRKNIEKPDSKIFVKPCVFVVFGEVYSQETFDLKDVFLNSKLFKAIRKRQPYVDNLLRPCQIIDVPNTLREVVKETGAMPAYPSAPLILQGNIAKEIDTIANSWKKEADFLWSDFQNLLLRFLLSKEELKSVLQSANTKERV